MASLQETYGPRLAGADGATKLALLVEATRKAQQCSGAEYLKVGSRFVGEGHVLRPTFLEHTSSVGINTPRGLTAVSHELFVRDYLEWRWPRNGSDGDAAQHVQQYLSALDKAVVDPGHRFDLFAVAKRWGVDSRTLESDLEALPKPFPEAAEKTVGNGHGGI